MQPCAKRRHDIQQVFIGVKKRRDFFDIPVFDCGTNVFVNLFVEHNFL